MSKKRKVIDVYGIVQGVGFRPFVYNLAIKNSLIRDTLIIIVMELL